MTLASLAEEISRHKEAMLAEDLNTGEVRMNEAGRRLLFPSCAAINITCLLCRIMPLDSKAILDANEKARLSGRGYSGKIRIQTSPGIAEWIGFRKHAVGNHLAISSFWPIGPVQHKEIHTECIIDHETEND